MSIDQQVIDALRAVICAKDEVIELLRAEVDRLKISQTVLTPPFGSPGELYIGPPNYIINPVIPPPDPLQPPFTVTCGPDGLGGHVYSGVGGIQKSNIIKNNNSNDPLNISHSSK